MSLRMLYLTCWFATVTLLVPGVPSMGQSATEVHYADLVGTWTLISIYRTSNVQGPSDSEAKRLLGTHIVYNVHTISSCGADNPIAAVKEKKLSPEDLLFDARIRFPELGLRGNAVKEITLEAGNSGTCFGAFPLPGQRFYIKSKNELVVDFEGVCYRAVRLHFYRSLDGLSHPRQSSGRVSVENAF